MAAVAAPVATTSAASTIKAGARPDIGSAGKPSAIMAVMVTLIMMISAATSGIAGIKRLNRIVGGSGAVGAHAILKALSLSLRIAQKECGNPENDAYEHYSKNDFEQGLPLRKFRIRAAKGKWN
jgi:hypothetical protein